MLRDINKAYVGFYQPLKAPQPATDSVSMQFAGPETKPSWRSVEAMSGQSAGGMDSRVTGRQAGEKVSASLSEGGCDEVVDSYILIVGLEMLYQYSTKMLFTRQSLLDKGASLITQQLHRQNIRCIAVYYFN